MMGRKRREVSGWMGYQVVGSHSYSPAAAASEAEVEVDGTGEDEFAVAVVVVSHLDFLSLIVDVGWMRMRSCDSRFDSQLSSFIALLLLPSSVFWHLD